MMCPDCPDMDASRMPPGCLPRARCCCGDAWRERARMKAEDAMARIEAELRNPAGRRSRFLNTSGLAMTEAAETTIRTKGK